MASRLCENCNKIDQKLVLNPCQTCLQQKLRKEQDIEFFQNAKTHESLGTVVDFESFAHPIGDPEMYEKTMKNHTISIRFSFRFYKKKMLGKVMGNNDGNRAQMACKKEAKQRK